MVAEAISGCNGIHLGRQGKEPRRTERRSGVLVRRGMAWGAAVAFSFMAATTAAAFHSQHSAARSPALLFAGPVLPFGRARARIGSSRQRSPSAQLVTLSGAGGLPLAIRFDQTKRMAARGGENGGQRLSARRSKSRDRSGADLRDGGEKDEDPRDSEDYTGVSSEFNALCQVAAHPSWGHTMPLKCRCVMHDAGWSMDVGGSVIKSGAHAGVLAATNPNG